MPRCGHKTVLSVRVTVAVSASSEVNMCMYKLEEGGVPQDLAISVLFVRATEPTKLKLVA